MVWRDRSTTVRRRSTTLASSDWIRTGSQRAVAVIARAVSSAEVKFLAGSISLLMGGRGVVRSGQARTEEGKDVHAPTALRSRARSTVV